MIESCLAPVVAYQSDIDYLSDHLAWLRARTAWKKIQLEGVIGRSALDDPEAAVIKLQAEEAVAHQLVRDRLTATRLAGTWEPRAEQLARRLALSDFETTTVLVLAGLSASAEVRLWLDRTMATIEVGDVLMLLCDSIEDQVRSRRHFYRDAPLVREGLLTFDGLIFDRDLLRVDVRLDARLTDYLLGLDTESGALVDGSHLYRPTLTIDRVVLPDRDKDLIVRTVEHFPRFIDERRRSGLDELVPYGSGMVFLFHGPSGTGKTMLANAIANHLGKRLLLVNYPTIGRMQSDETLKFLFREARLQDAVLFFDECEGIFGERDRNPGMSLILTELERHDGLVILATNRPLDLDEAMQRRITLALAFRAPAADQRERIWRAHIPAKLNLVGEPDFPGLAYRYELTGGLIKNAVVAALAIAASREDESVLVRPEDFEKGARLQMRGRFAAGHAGDSLVPEQGLNELVAPPALRLALDEVLSFEKARRTIVNEWGLGGSLMRGVGTTALFHGGPGTGKTMAAEAIACELGRPLRRVNAAQVVSKWVGEGAKNLEQLFADARQSDAVLLFDEADALFAHRTDVATSTDRYANVDVAVLLREIELFPGVAILTSNLVENIDPAFRRRLRFVVEFPMPDAVGRESLWRMFLGAGRIPQRDDIRPTMLAQSFELTGAEIRNAVVRAAARASTRNGEFRFVHHGDLAEAARQEVANADRPRAMGFARQEYEIRVPS